MMHHALHGAGGQRHRLKLTNSPYLLKGAGRRPQRSCRWHHRPMTGLRSRNNTASCGIVRIHRVRVHRAGYPSGVVVFHGRTHARKLLLCLLLDDGRGQPLIAIAAEAIQIISPVVVHGAGGVDVNTVALVACGARQSSTDLSLQGFLLGRALCVSHIHNTASQSRSNLRSLLSRGWTDGPVMKTNSDEFTSHHSFRAQTREEFSSKIRPFGFHCWRVIVITVRRPYFRVDRTPWRAIEEWIRLFSTDVVLRHPSTNGNPDRQPDLPSRGCAMTIRRHN